MVSKVPNHSLIIILLFLFYSIHYPTNFHDTSFAFVNIHPVTIAYILLRVLESVLGERGADFADQHLFLRCLFLYVTTAHCAGSRAGIRIFFLLRAIDTSLGPLGWATQE